MPEEFKWTTTAGCKIVDRRADRFASVYGFVVFKDTFMSGWGEAPRTSWYALACDSRKEAERVLRNGKRRSEMKLGGIVDVDLLNLPEMTRRRGDHLSIVDKSTAARWYKPGAFGPDEAGGE